MDDLSRIERIYGCVTEYNRCMEEDAAREYEKKEKRWRDYEFEQLRVIEYQANGYTGIAEAFCHIDACHSCKTRTRTFIQDEDDDIGTFFCLNERCKHAKKHNK